MDIHDWFKVFQHFVDLNKILQSKISKSVIFTKKAEPISCYCSLSSPPENIRKYHRQDFASNTKRLQAN